MSNISSWSTTAGSNNSAAPNGAPEGMAPSGVNDVIRENMAAASKFYKDTQGTLVSTGSANAYVLTTNSAHATLAAQSLIAFRANFTNTGAATIAVDGLAAKSIYVEGAEATAGDIVSGVTYLLTYNSAGDVYDLMGVNAYQVPLPTPGTSGNVLTSDGTDWTSAASTGGLTPLSQVVASSASSVDVDTVFTSDYDEYEVRIQGLTASTVAVLYIKMNIGGSYLSANYSSHAGRPNSSSAAYAAMVVSGGTSGIGVHNNGWSGTGNSMDLIIRVHKPSETSLKKIIDWHGSAANGASQIEHLSGSGFNTATGALTGLRFTPDAGTISGTFTVYGIPKGA